MNVLLVLPSLKKTGPINVAFNILRWIKNDHPHVIVDVVSFANGELFLDFMSCANTVKIIKGKWYLKVLNFKKIINSDVHYDVIHSHCLLPDLVNYLYHGKAKSISTLHNYIDVDYILDKGGIKGKIMAIVHRFIFNNLNTVVSCSHSVLSFVKKNYGINSIFIRNGVDSGDGTLAVSNCGERMCFIMMGVFNERKNMELAIEAFSKSNKRDCRLTILGDGPLLNGVKEKYASDNIVFMGNVNCPRLYLKQHDVYLSSSTAEGLPMAVLEAMSESLCYLLSDIAPHREIFELSVGAGQVVSNDVGAFVEALNRLDVVDVVEMKKKAFISFNKNFQASTMSEKYVALYEKIVKV